MIEKERSNSFNGPAEAVTWHGYPLRVFRGSGYEDDRDCPIFNTEIRKSYLDDFSEKYDVVSVYQDDFRCIVYYRDKEKREVPHQLKDVVSSMERIAAASADINGNLLNLIAIVRTIIADQKRISIEETK